MTRSEERGGPKDELPSFSGTTGEHQDAPETEDFDASLRCEDDQLEERQGPADQEPSTPHHLDHAVTQ